MEILYSLTCDCKQSEDNRVLPFLYGMVSVVLHNPPNSSVVHRILKKEKNDSVK